MVMSTWHGCLLAMLVTIFCCEQSKDTVSALTSDVRCTLTGLKHIFKFHKIPQMYKSLMEPAVDRGVLLCSWESANG